MKKDKKLDPAGIPSLLDFFNSCLLSSVFVRTPASLAETVFSLPSCGGA